MRFLPILLGTGLFINSAEQAVHGYIQNFCNCVQFFVGGYADLSLQLGIACGIDVTAHSLHSGDEILLGNLLFLPQFFDGLPYHIDVTIRFFSCFHIDHHFIV